MIELLLGHLVGDYVLQWNYMAHQKKLKTLEGLFYCILHCILYSISICFFIKNFSIFILIFASHYFVDRYSWLSTLHIKILKRPSVCSNDPLGIFCYVALDNTIHLVLMYYVIKLFV